MNNKDEIPEGGLVGKLSRAGLNIAGAIPMIGGVFSAASGAWSEHEQKKMNDFLKHWIQMLEDEIKEKAITMIEIMQRLDLADEKVAERVKTSEFQSLVKKSFRDWSGIESESKRTYIRNIIANAASTDLSSDDVIRLFIDWINKYSELHFQVMACVYQNSQGISRGEIWEKIGKKKVPENSSDADLYKLLIRDLSTGGIIRQGRQTDRQGNFLKQQPAKRKNTASNTMASAFDKEELYELTSLGKDFIHYAMTELPIKIEYNPSEETV